MNYPDIKYIKNNRYTKQLIKKEYPEFYQYIENNYPKDLQWKQKLYWFYHNINSTPICPICNKPVNFLDFLRGYRTYCSCQCANKDPLYKDKIHQSVLLKYGVNNVFQNKEIQTKYKQTMLTKHGVDNPNKLKTTRNKAKQTNLKKYGVENVRYAFTDIIDTTPNENGEYKRKCPHPECTKCEEKFYWADVQLHGNRIEFNVEPCTRLLPRVKQFNYNTSLELFIHRILDEYNIEYEKNNRKILNGKELDIYIPSKNIAIECNGVYWHSVECISPKDKDYHFNKWKECKDRGIELLTIWDYQIYETPDNIKDMLLKKLGINEFIQICDSDTYIANNDFDFIPEGFVFDKCIFPEKHIINDMTYYDCGKSVYKRT